MSIVGAVVGALAIRLAFARTLARDAREREGSAAISAPAPPDLPVEPALVADAAAATAVAGVHGDEHHDDYRQHEPGDPQHSPRE
jgi:hypothetical protein